MSQNPQKPRASSPQTPPGSEKSGCLSFEGAHEAAISNKPTQNGGTFKQTHPRPNREKERRKKASVWAIWMQGCFRAACSPNLKLAKSGSAEFGFLMDRKTKILWPPNQSGGPDRVLGTVSSRHPSQGSYAYVTKRIGGTQIPSCVCLTHGSKNGNRNRSENGCPHHFSNDSQGMRQLGESRYNSRNLVSSPLLPDGEGFVPCAFTLVTLAWG